MATTEISFWQISAAPLTSIKSDDMAHTVCLVEVPIQVDGVASEHQQTERRSTKEGCSTQALGVTNHKSINQNPKQNSPFTFTFLWLGFLTCNVPVLRSKSSSVGNTESRCCSFFIECRFGFRIWSQISSQGSCFNKRIRSKIVSHRRCTDLRIWGKLVRDHNLS